MVQPENNKKKQQQTAVFVKDPAAFPCVPLLFSAQDPSALLAWGCRRNSEPVRSCFSMEKVSQLYVSINAYTSYGFHTRLCACSVAIGGIYSFLHYLLS